ncbi:hypothetical protein Psi01_52840 [Planobispora siamensis]|uniref:Uncharacterized protein n=2 Tax=Planobispora siamensis TaxID=936338 RepID=A0A8J3WKX9_9ACTN|nr:hypothetical protein Psi01_52840 [Planobispora siamensis]
MLSVIYVITAAPVFLVAGRVILQHATPEAVEVFMELPGRLPGESYDSRIEPFNHALDRAAERAEAHPEDLAPPYLLRHPWRVVAPCVSPRGHELAAAPLTGVAWPDGLRTPFTIVPEVRPARYSHAGLMAVMDADPGPFGDDRIHGAGIDAERNLVVLDANGFDQELRHRLARNYGSERVSLRWEPWGEPAIHDLG